MAYNFIPESKKDILVKPEFKKQPRAQAELVVLYDYLRKHFPEILTPIALDPSNPKTVKVTRRITSAIAVTKLKTMAKAIDLRISPGEGSRGGRGASNLGNAFEKQLEQDIMNWVKGDPIRNTAHASFIEDFVRYYKLTAMDRVQVIAEGALNKKRPLLIQGDAVYVGTSGDPNIGQVVTDITVDAENKQGKHRTIFLSLKYGGTVTFFNVGIAKAITPEDFSSGKIHSAEGKAIMKLFGLDEKKFLGTFSSTKKYAPEDVTGKINKGRLTAFIKSGIGHGYHLVHLLNNKIDHFEMTKQHLEKSSQPISVRVLYGGASGTAKRVDILVETKEFSLKFNLRNKAGGVNPNFIMCDYKKKH